MSSPRPETLNRLTDIVFDKVMNTLRTPSQSGPLYELLSDMMTRLDSELDQPLRLSAAIPNSNKLLIKTNRILSGDGGNRSLPPDDGAFNLFVDTSVDFHSGSVSGGTVKRDAGTFSLPNVTVGQYVRAGFAYDSTNNWINSTFSSASASVSGLQNPSALMANLDETWIGYIDLESDGVSSFKTPGSTSGYIENAVGGIPYIHRFIFNGPVNTRHLDDVSTTTPSDGNFLIYDSGSSKWLPIYMKYKTETATISSNTITPTTGANVQRITGSAADIQMLASPADGKVLALINETGSSITVKNDTGGTSANRIYTGTGVDLTLKNQAGITLIYDSGLTRWIVVGGSGGGGLATVPQATTVSAAAGNHYLTNTSGGAFTATLPAGIAGSVIMFSDANESWDSFNLTITPASGEKIDNLATNESLVCDVKRGWVELSWNTALSSWSMRSLAATNVVTATATQAGIVSTNAQTFAGLKTFQDGIAVSSGTLAVPGIAFSSDADGSGTGLYLIGANNPGFVSNGVLVGQYDSTAKWTLGISTGLGTGAAAYQSIFGSVRSLSASGGTGNFFSTNGCSFGVRNYVDGSNAFKATSTATGYARIDINTTSFDFIANTTQAQVADAALNTTGQITAMSLSTAGVATIGPSSSDSIAHSINGSLYFNTAIPSFSSSSNNYIGSSAANILFRKVNTSFGFIWINGNYYFDGTSSKFSRLNETCARLVVQGTTATTGLSFDFLTDTSISHAADAAASPLTIGNATTAGTWTLGAASGSGTHILRNAQNNIIQLSNTTSGNAGIDFQNSGGRLGVISWDSSNNLRFVNNGGSTIIFNMTSAGVTYINDGTTASGTPSDGFTIRHQTTTTSGNGARLSWANASGTRQCSIRNSGSGGIGTTYDLIFETYNSSSNQDSMIIAGSGSITLGPSGGGVTHRLNTNTASTVGAAGGASALPATPTGYITINVNGTDRKVPYYAT